LLEGIFGCQDSCPTPGSDYGTNDALFHPVHGGICKIDPDTAEKAVRKQAGGSLENALKPYLDTVWKLQETLDCRAPRLCNPQTLTCSLETLPSKIRKTNDGVTLEGPISVGSTASEVFLLEYAQDMPEVAWEGVSASTPERINSLLKLHDL
jgi:4-phytase/acid phosphatase